MKTLRFLILPIVLSILGGSGLLWAQGAPSGIPQTLRVRTLGVSQTPSALSGHILATATDDTSLNPQQQIINTTAGCTSDLCTYFNYSNATDADFQLKVTDVGAATKFAQIGPVANIPFKFVSRATSQELLKTAAATSTSGAGACTFTLGYNVTSCTRTGVGVYTVNLTAANFTQTPVCVSSTTGLAVVVGVFATSSTSTGVSTSNSTTGAAVDSNWNIICTGQ